MRNPLSLSEILIFQTYAEIPFLVLHFVLSYYVILYLSTTSYNKLIVLLMLRETLWIFY